MLAFKMLDGQYFPKKASNSYPAKISIISGYADIYQGATRVELNLAFESIQDRQNIYFKNESLFVLDIKLTNEEMRSVTSRGEGLLSWLERFSFKKAIILASILIIAIIGYRYLYYTVSPILVAAFPVEWEQQIGKNAYKGLEASVFAPSELSEKRIVGLTKKAQNLIEVNEIARQIEIKFHKSDFIGVNALALPGGPIVITDGLVDLLQNDNEILAVIAHEIAHVQERHSLQQIIEVVGILAMASVLFGGDEALIEEATVVAINLWSFKKSRNFEREADIVGLGLLETANISKNHFINAIEKLTNHYCQSASQDDIQNCLANSDSGWFSTHPSGAERLEYLAND